jgi:hypothetical protein
VATRSDLEKIIPLLRAEIFGDGEHFVNRRPPVHEHDALGGGPDKRIFHALGF